MSAKKSAKKTSAGRSARAALSLDGSAPSKKQGARKPHARLRAGRSGSVAVADTTGAEGAAPRETSEGFAITVRTKDGSAFTLHSSKLLQRAAIQWTYVLRNRQRWVAQESVRTEQSRRTLDLFEELGVSGEDIKALADSDVVEVSVPFVQEAAGWEARIFPWEYMLTAATREYRRDRAMIVVRHLDRAAVAPAQRTDLSKLLYVESAPAGLKGYYTFDSERALLKTTLEDLSFNELLDPTVAALQGEVSSLAPDLIHLAGIDNHQAAQLLKVSDEKQDGYAMAGEQSGVEYVGAERLASALTAAARPPALVSFNFYNSGPRIGALAVAAGAEAAIGFQDEFDDVMTEFFFTSFYHDWRLSGWNLLEAFRRTCNTLRPHGGLYGTGVVLWSARTLVGHGTAAAASPRRGRAAGATLAKPAAAAELEERVKSEKESAKYIQPESVEPDRLSEVLQVTIKPYGSLNYSMLHNDRPLFREFRISKPGSDYVRGIVVKVVLWAGPTSFPYEQTLDITGIKPADLSGEIRVPLIYTMGTPIHESVHTSLYVSVTWGKHTLYSNTHRVTLLPLDEWRDDDNDRVWLPSFVLPRDRSVNRVVDAGQRYLWALADDSGAGFDGYQAVEEPKPGELITDGVDLQVQALWAALAYEMNLGYINPPPSYNLSSQRVRTPSEVIEGHRGTCIDLALLLATCCEYVDIYPVIFLLEGHAFPGYWRSDAYHQSFIKMTNSLSPAGADARPTGQPQATTGTAQRFPWYLDKSFYAEVVQQVRDLKLVPVESTLIPRRGGFWEAVDAGIENLRSKRQFHSLIDVRLARDNQPPVTPIPLRGRHE